MGLSGEDEKFIKDNFVKNMDRNYDEQAVEDGMKREMDNNWEWWDEMSCVEKPEFIIKKQEAERELRRGFLVNTIGNPLDNEMFVAMDTKSFKNDNILIARKETYDGDMDTGEIIKSKTKYKEKTRVLFLSKLHKKRFNFNNQTYLILREKDILGIL